MKRSWGQLGSGLLPHDKPPVPLFLRSWPQRALHVFNRAFCSYYKRSVAVLPAFRLGIWLQGPPPAPTPALPVSSSTGGRLQLLWSKITLFRDMIKPL